MWRSRARQTRNKLYGRHSGKATRTWSSGSSSVQPSTSSTRRSSRRQRKLQVHRVAVRFSAMCMPCRRADLAQQEPPSPATARLSQVLCLLCKFGPQKDLLPHPSVRDSLPNDQWCSLRQQVPRDPPRSSMPLRHHRPFRRCHARQAHISSSSSSRHTRSSMGSLGLRPHCRVQMATDHPYSLMGKEASLCHMDVALHRRWDTDHSSSHRRRWRCQARCRNQCHRHRMACKAVTTIKVRRHLSNAVRPRSAVISKQHMQWSFRVDASNDAHREASTALHQGVRWTASRQSQPVHAH